MGVDAVSACQRSTGWTAAHVAIGNRACSLFLGGDLPALPRAVDRFDPTDHSRRAGPGVRVSLVRSHLLLSRHRDRCRRRKPDRASQKEIVECSSLLFNKLSEAR